MLDVLFSAIEGWPGIRNPSVKDFIVKYQITADAWYVANLGHAVVETGACSGSARPWTSSWTRSGDRQQPTSRFFTAPRRCGASRGRADTDLSLKPPRTRVGNTTATRRRITVGSMPSFREPVARRLARGFTCVMTPVDRMSVAELRAEATQLNSFYEQHLEGVSVNRAVATAGRLDATLARYFDVHAELERRTSPHSAIPETRHRSAPHGATRRRTAPTLR